MIDKRELLDMAERLGLGPHIVEKDYALGWVLAGISQHPALADTWVFKGGTCLKKCYFETYRFSEDLDFTLTDPSHINADFLSATFAEIAEWVYEAAGLELPADLQRFDVYENPRGNLSCQGRLSYRGPLAPRSGGLPRIKLDLTADERLVLAPVRVPIYHPYSDAPADGISVFAYAYEETFAEKTRALAERTRPRDLYDVINLFRNGDARPAAAVLLDVLRQKCEFKGIGLPRLDDLRPHRPDLEGAWETMLRHQLPALPPLDSFWAALPGFFAWLETGVAPAAPAPYALVAGETVIRDRSFSLTGAGAARSAMEIIRFAAANRLCVDLDYIDMSGRRSTRRIEPYSLRRTLDDNIILHAFNTEKNAHRSYRVDRIQGAQTTGQTFVPRYEVELTPQGPVHIAPTTTGIRSTTRAPTTRRAAARPRRRARSASSYGFGASSGPTYVYECSFCGKKFRRKKQNTRLNPHKDKSGYPCPGRTGFWVDTQY